MNAYRKEIFYDHVRKFHSEKLMTTNSLKNMSDEKKYTVIIPFIGHPSMISKSYLLITYKALTKNDLQYLKHLEFKTTFL